MPQFAGSLERSGRRATLHMHARVCECWIVTWCKASWARLPRDITCEAQVCRWHLKTRSSAPRAWRATAMVSSPGPVIKVLSYSICVGSSSFGLQVAK